MGLSGRGPGHVPGLVPPLCLHDGCSQKTLALVVGLPLEGRKAARQGPSRGPMAATFGFLPTRSGYGHFDYLLLRPQTET
jgi:hypothetical protein